MNCPSCKNPFVVEQDDKCQCSECGWFEKVDNEWRVCDEPSPEPVPEPEQIPEPSPAALEPDPAKREPSPSPQAKVKEYLGGLVTVTEIDE